MNKLSEQTGINWILRLKNKAVLLPLLTSIVVFVYTLLGIFGITPSVTQDKITDLIMAFVQILVMSGIVTDPTTSGITDSKEALEYSEPKQD